MAIVLDERDLKHGVLGLVIALVEVIRDALRSQAVRRMGSGDLSEAECERLGQALMALDNAIEEIKRDQGIEQSVQAVRDGLDDMVSDLVDKLMNPGVLLEAGARRSHEDR